MSTGEIQQVRIFHSNTQMWRQMCTFLHLLLQKPKFSQQRAPVPPEGHHCTVPPGKSWKGPLNSKATHSFLKVSSKSMEFFAPQRQPCLNNWVFLHKTFWISTRGLGRGTVAMDTANPYLLHIPVNYLKNNQNKKTNFYQKNN